MAQTREDTGSPPTVSGPPASQIAFTCWTRERGEQILTMQPDGSDIRPLTGGEGQGENGQPSWSPDGRRLCFISRRNGYGQLYAMNADGSEHERLTCVQEADDHAPAWSPDGGSIVFSRGNRTGADVLVLLDLTSGVERQLTEGDLVDSSPSWSPDGRWIAFRRSFADPPGIYVIPADGGDARFLVPGHHPNWSPHGDCLAYAYGAALWLAEVDEAARSVGRATPLVCDSELLIRGSSWSPDADALVFEAEIVTESGRSRRLMTVNVGGGGPREAGEGSQPDWSPLLQQA